MDSYFLVGTYTEPILFGTGEVLQGKGEGLYLCTLGDDGSARVLDCLKIANPSYVEINERGRHIYAVNEMKEYHGAYGGGLTDIVYNGEMKMTVAADFEAGGADPCHVAASPDGSYVCTANFADGKVTVFPLDEDGAVLPEKTVYTHTGRSIDPSRQLGPHAHAVLFSKDGHMFVPDLGLDMLKAYLVTGEGIVPDEAGSAALTPGSGPRSGVWSEDGRHLYVINELDSTVTHLRCDGDRPETAERVSTLPPGYQGGSDCADLHLTGDGRFLYASNRGSNLITVFRVAEDGSLTAIGWEPCGGKTPRNFAIEPEGRYLLVGNQDSDLITMFAIQGDGLLSRVSEVKIPTPVCIRFFSR